MTTAIPASPLPSFDDEDVEIISQDNPNDISTMAVMEENNNISTAITTVAAPTTTTTTTTTLTSPYKEPFDPEILDAMDRDAVRLFSDAEWLSNNGATFEELMRERNRLRKVREEYHLAELKVQIQNLEAALAAETKRRLDATTLLEERAKQEVHDMEERLRTQMEQENKRIDERLQAIESRVERMESQWKKDSLQQTEAILTKADHFQEALDELKRDQETERKAKLRREGKFLQQVEDLSKEFETRWNTERTERMEEMVKLEKRTELNTRNRNQQDIDFQSRVEEELEALQRELEEEMQERQSQDEEIVAALNRYTAQLQHSLSVLSAD